MQLIKCTVPTQSGGTPTTGTPAGAQQPKLKSVISTYIGDYYDNMIQDIADYSVGQFNDQLKTIHGMDWVEIGSEALGGNYDSILNKARAASCNSANYAANKFLPTVIGACVGLVLVGAVIGYFGGDYIGKHSKRKGK